MCWGGSSPCAARGCGVNAGCSHRRRVRFVAIRLLVVALSGMLLAVPASVAVACQGCAGRADAPTILAVNGDPIQRLVLPGPRQRAVYVVGNRGLYRASEDGSTWQAVGPPPPAPGIAAAADASLLLAGSRSACGRAQGQNLPLFRSRDGGATWEPVAGIGDLLPLAIWSEPALALGASCAGLRVSIDGGLTWRPAPAMPADRLVTAFAPAVDERDAPTVFVVGTAEGGMSVLSLVTLTARGEVGASEPLRDFWGSGAIDGSRQRPVLGTANGVLVSRDGGQTWRLGRHGLEDVTLSVDPTTGPIPDEELRRGFGITAIAADPTDADRIYVGTIAGVYRSGDGGVTWVPVPGTGGVTEALIVTPRGTLLIQTESAVFEVVLSQGGGLGPQAATPALPGPSPAAVLATPRS